jgi:hypothetical protein
LREVKERRSGGASRFGRANAGEIIEEREGEG